MAGLVADGPPSKKRLRLKTAASTSVVDHGAGALNEATAGCTSAVGDGQDAAKTTLKADLWRRGGIEDRTDAAHPGGQSDEVISLSPDEGAGLIGGCLVVGATDVTAIPQQDIDAVASRIQSAMMRQSSKSPRLLPKGEAVYSDQDGDPGGAFLSGNRRGGTVWTGADWTAFRELLGLGGAEELPNTRTSTGSRTNRSAQRRNDTAAAPHATPAADGRSSGLPGAPPLVDVAIAVAAPPPPQQQQQQQQQQSEAADRAPLEGRGGGAGRAGARLVASGVKSIPREPAPAPKGAPGRQTTHAHAAAPLRSDSRDTAVHHQPAPQVPLAAPAPWCNNGEDRQPGRGAAQADCGNDFPSTGRRPPGGGSGGGGGAGERSDRRGGSGGNSMDVSDGRHKHDHYHRHDQKQQQQQQQQQNQQELDPGPWQHRQQQQQQPRPHPRDHHHQQEQQQQQSDPGQRQQYQHQQQHPHQQQRYQHQQQQQRGCGEEATVRGAEWRQGNHVAANEEGGGSRARPGGSSPAGWERNQGPAVPAAAATSRHQGGAGAAGAPSSAGRSRAGRGGARASAAASSGAPLSQPQQSQQRSLVEMGWVMPPGPRTTARLPSPAAQGQGQGQQQSAAAAAPQRQQCPICSKPFPPGTFNSAINKHIDECLNQVALDAGDDF